MSEFNKLISTLQNFPRKGKFKLNQHSSLTDVCNISRINDCSGVYLFYDDDTNELLYIGISGRETSDGEIRHRKDGLWGRLVKGKQFGDFRRKTLVEQMKKEGILILRVEWFITYCHDVKEIPRQWEYELLRLFLIENNRLPKWNNEL
ncbi:MAG: hypothetical protein PHY55_02590 [Bacteroidales bacterium]|jgi:hypothetical protein|nr:hypothetical protein [Bacteroidales bacterium]